MNKLTLLSAGCNSRIYCYGQGSQQVVLKVVEGGSLKEQKHLKNQFQFLQSLHHRHVVKSLRYRQNVVFPGNKTDKQLKTTTSSNILVLEHASRGSLLNYLQKEKPQLTSKRQAFRHIVQGLAYLHSQGIAHRDLKLQNILVFVQDGQLVFKIGDLGFATRFIRNESSLKFNEYKGTRKGYMAPQIHQCAKDRSVEYDAAKADIFALGVILFALVFNKLPFEFAEPSDPYFKKIMNKQFSAFWSGHNCSKFELQKGMRLEEMKGLFERMVSHDPCQRITVEEVLDSEWLIE